MELKKKIFGPAVADQWSLMEQQRIALIANPDAGARDAQRVVLRAHQALAGYALQSIVPSSRDELLEVCRSLSSKSHRAAVIIGGDGTLNAALQALWKDSSTDPAVPIYAFPGGTANDLSSELGLDRSTTQIRQLLDGNCLSKIDVITCNGVPFTTVSGVGLGATITGKFNDLRQRSPFFGWLIKILKAELYTAMTAKTILASRQYIHHVSIQSEQLTKSLRVSALFVCNQNKLGGSLSVGSGNNNQDGIFSVLVVPESSPLSLLKTLALIRRGKWPKEALSFSTNRLSIESLDGREMPVFGDGEILMRSKKLQFKIHPKTLRVFSGNGKA
ncbi:MAG: hypothetical protein KGQ59_08415 [Bdellovibrionales bacterium]|nr:hypothetical protein [Bdellovibrionales bacterium]